MSLKRTGPHDVQYNTHDEDINVNPSKYNVYLQDTQDTVTLYKLGTEF